GHRPGGGDRPVHGGKPGGQVADEYRPAFTVGPGERRGDAGHWLTAASRAAALRCPNQREAVVTSLSPRPDRLTSSSASGPVSLPTWSAPASACADSRAGMIPAVRHSSGKAPMAWVSVRAR